MADPSIVWLNGRLLRASEARISPFDRGFLVGDGVFETLACRGGRVIAARRHWERLRASCETMDLAAPKEEVFREALEVVARASELTDARLRVTLTRGEMGEGTMLATATALTAWPALEKIRTVPWARNEHDALAGVKSTSYSGNARALAFAKAHDGGEAVFANTRGELCEGAGSNVFLVSDGVILTPPLSSGCLAGVTRALVIELCQQHGITLREHPLPMSALGGCDEIFITSSIRDVQAVGQTDDRVLPPAPDPVTRRLASLLRDLVAQNADP